MSGVAAEALWVRRGGADLLRGVSLTLGATASVALIGPNGAGKSTLLKVLAGLERPASGTVRLADRDLATMPPAARSRAIGFLPQNFEPHWDLTVEQLLQLGARRGDRLPVDVLEKATTTFELSTLRRRRWSTLSGGERARALLAMVLVVEPPVLLADEPAASLDIRHRLAVVRALAARGRKGSSVVVVHDLDLAFAHFDRIVLMSGGEIVADGPAARLLTDCRLDEAFGMRFSRLETEQGYVLRPKPG
jgi:iron complex transport system ATP-binding protein